MGKRFFGTDGIRGRVGEAPITPDFLLHLGWAAGRVFAHEGVSNILIGKDTRISGYMIESVLEAGLSAAGVNVQHLAVLPTPAIAYLTRTFRADAGIVISASHNPYYDNGIKFFSPQGNKLPDEMEARIEAQLDEPLRTVGSASLGKATRIYDAPGRYIEFCKSTYRGNADLRGMKIVVDCANGATYNVGPHVFSELGARVVAIGDEPDGKNINDACGSTHPQALVEAVGREQADLGIAFDGDGDRVLMVDSRGQIVDGDALIYAIATHRAAAGESMPGVVGTLMSNLGLERGLARLGIDFARANVGDRYVLEGLNERGWLLGGESSGHIICLDRTSTGDGIVSALNVLEAMAASERSLDELVAPMQRCPQIMHNVKVQDPGRVNGCEAVASAVAAAERAMGASGRVLIRPSGTEPVVRVMVECEDPEATETHVQALTEVVRRELGAG